MHQQKQATNAPNQAKKQMPKDEEYDILNMIEKQLKSNKDSGKSGGTKSGTF
jgi:hypothetical protein|tara:strand:+ start:320 stop:475 length:156 start_codon:yes stop_codon:yes gene_type:complete